MNYFRGWKLRVRKNREILFFRPLHSPWKRQKIMIRTFTREWRRRVKISLKADKSKKKHSTWMTRIWTLTQNIHFLTQNSDFVTQNRIFDSNRFLTRNRILGLELNCRLKIESLSGINSKSIQKSKVRIAWKSRNYNCKIKFLT